jgi:hypothetical protein
MKKNFLLILENGFAWSGVIAAYAMAILPIIQVLAGVVAFVFSLLSIIKICKNWYEKD